MNHLITGGAGFIGCNLAAALLARGEPVTLFDNLSRPLTPLNLAWLQQQYGAQLRFVQADMRDAAAVQAAVAGHDIVYHLAGQVAVTTSVRDPRSDFEINALGTLNLLEAARLASRPPIVFYASTNKVYGGMETVTIVEEPQRYRYRDLEAGVPETQLLDFHSPYGCSKGAADQYVRDYARIYGLRTVVFRQSCLAADQPVVTPFGLKPIAVVRDGDIVHSGYGWTRVRRVWQTGTKSVQRVTTAHGLQITLTPDHRVVRPHGLFSSQILQPGDALAVLPEARYTPAWQEVADLLLDSEQLLQAVAACSADQRQQALAQQTAERLLPLRGDRLLAVAELGGRLFAEYRLAHSSAGENSGLRFSGTRAELHEIAERLDWLGLPTGRTIRPTRTTPQHQRATIRVDCLEQHAPAVNALFALLGVADDAAEIPPWVMTGHILVKRAFLRGLVGGLAIDLEWSNEPALLLGAASGRQAGLCQLHTQLGALLREFGIGTTISAHSSGVHVLRLHGGDELPLRLAAIGCAFNPDVVRQINTLVQQYWLAATPARAACSALQQADGLLFWDSVQQIDQLEPMPVYDLEVTDETHLVLAGGIQVSNCIYGPRQFGVEDQGWAAHFVIAAEMGRPITIYGNGKQVRDMLYIDDLIAAYFAALERIEQASGQIYNIGGGPQNALAVWAEFGPLLERLVGRPIPVHYGDWRPGDQPVYVSDIRKAASELNWRPQVSVAEGMSRLLHWVQANRSAF